MLFGTLFDIFMIIAQAIQALVLVMVVLSLLFSFNVINSHNTFLTNSYHAINRLLDPMLNPIRRLLPDTGGMDFSPLVLLIALQIIERVLVRYSMTYL